MTEKEKVLLLREAFVSGAGYRHSRVTNSAYADEYWEEAKRRYPLPKVTRPRVVTVPMSSRSNGPFCDFKVSGNVIYAAKPPLWEMSVHTPAGILMLADLVRNPTEEVEVD